MPSPQPLTKCVWCLKDRRSMSEWEQERLGGKFSASPIYAQGRVYCQNEAGTTIVFKASPQFEELARNQLAEGERTFASFAVVDRALLLRSEKHLYRIEE